MKKQVAVINITRMGDLFQMTPLLARLEEEWPGVAIDLIVDKEFAGVAGLLPGIRQVLAYDFQQLLDESRAKVRDVVSLYQDVAAWAKPLLQIGYDRVINLTFNRRSAFLSGFLASKDTRGMTTTAQGHMLVCNPWMKYFLDFQQHRSLNRFNIVDLFALGGSGPGSFHPVHLPVPSSLEGWGERFLKQRANPAWWVGIQVGASDPIKAWRPASYGRMMALLGARIPVGFVLIGTAKEEPAIREAIRVYREVGGTAPICEAYGKTTVEELLSLLSCCRLMVTNDTGPMHMAVGLHTQVVNLSVGHVDFWETGPFGVDHWVIQPDIACGPCGFDTVCPHHACKDRLEPQEVADLCLHLLGKASFPRCSPSMRVYQGCIDEDQLGGFMLRAGTEKPLEAWYGRFWRKFWFEMFTGRMSALSLDPAYPPDKGWIEREWDSWVVQTAVWGRQANQIQKWCRQRPIPVQALQEAQEGLKGQIISFVSSARSSPVLSPLLTAFFRDLHNLQGINLVEMAEEQAQVIDLLLERMQAVGKRLHLRGKLQEQERGRAYASTAR